MTAKEFIMALPNKVSPEALEGHTTCFHFDVPGEGGGEFTLDINEGKANVQEGFHGDPKCVIKTKPNTLVKIVQGEENPMMAFMMGKIKVSNQGEMLKYAKMLGLM